MYIQILVLCVPSHGQLNLHILILICSHLTFLVPFMYGMFNVYEESTMDQLLTLLFSVLPFKNFPSGL